MRRHAGLSVARPLRRLAFLVSALLTLALAGGSAQIIGLPDDTLCGPSGAGGCGGDGPGDSNPGDGGPDAPDAGA